MTDWITDADVRSALGLVPADIADDAWLSLCTVAVNRFVDDTRPVPLPPGGHVVDGRTRWGAVQLATRWYSRRNAQDVAAYAELGGPPPSVDRDIEISLQINRYFGPAVA
jgi:hypothetical protein